MTRAMNANSFQKVEEKIAPKIRGNCPRATTTRKAPGKYTPSSFENGMRNASVHLTTLASDSRQSRAVILSSASPAAVFSISYAAPVQQMMQGSQSNRESNALSPARRTFKDTPDRPMVRAWPQTSLQCAWHIFTVVLLLFVEGVQQWISLSFVPVRTFLKWI